MKTIPAIIMLLTVFAINSCQKEPDLSKDIITVKMNKDTIYLNKNETAQVIVTMSRFNAEKVVDLKITGGTIDGVTALQGLTPNSTNGDSAIFVRTFIPGNATGTFSIIATISGSSQSKTFVFVILNQDVQNVLELSIPNTAIADSLDTFTVTSKVKNTSASQIRFTTSRGRFENGLNSIERTINGEEISVEVTTGQSNLPHIITCELVGTQYSKNINYTPVPALPQMLDLSSSAWSIDSSHITSGNAISFTARLSRNQGYVTTSRIVEASAYQWQGSQKVFYGTFYNLLLRSGKDEQVTCNYFASPGLDADQPLVIVFKTQGENGIISDTISLDVTK